MTTTPINLLFRTLCAAGLMALAGSASLGAADTGAAAVDSSVRPTTLTAGATALLIDDQLRAEAVRLLQFNESSLVIIDGSGRRVRIPAEGLVALLPSASLPDPAHGVGAVSPVGAQRAVPLDELRRRLEAATGGFVQTIDGTRFPGQPMATTGSTDMVAWAHPRFGEMAFEIESLASFVKPQASGLRVVLEEDPVEDVLHLANGDLLRGFIVSLADPVEIETDGTVIQIPNERVSAAVLSNPRKHLRGLIVWLDDGTVAGVERLVSDSGVEIQLTLPSGQDAIYEIEHLRAIGFGSGRLVALSDLEPTSQVPVGDRLLGTGITLVQHPDDLLTGSAATLDAFDVELPGPMVVEYELPRGAIRFATTASLADASSPWGDCELIVSIDGVERLRQRITQADPVAPINVPIESGRTLTITLDPGRFGPIKDRVILHRPLLLLARAME